MNAATPTLRCYAARCGKRVVPLQNVRRPAAGLRRHLHGTASSSTSTANDLPRYGLLQLFGAAVVGATGALLLVRLRNAEPQERQLMTLSYRRHIRDKSHCEQKLLLQQINIA